MPLAAKTFKRRLATVLVAVDVSRTPVAAALVARALERPLGSWVQRHLTVSTDLLAVSIEGIERTVAGR